MAPAPLSCSCIVFSIIVFFLQMSTLFPDFFHLLSVMHVHFPIHTSCPGSFFFSLGGKPASKASTSAAVFSPTVTKNKGI